MARYKTIATDPKLLAVDLGRQLLPGTTEHAVDYLFDHVTPPAGACLGPGAWAPWARERLLRSE